MLWAGMVHCPSRAGTSTHACQAMYWNILSALRGTSAKWLECIGPGELAYSERHTRGTMWRVLRGVPALASQAGCELAKGPARGRASPYPTLYRLNGRPQLTVAGRSLGLAPEALEGIEGNPSSG